MPATVRQILVPHAPGARAIDVFEDAGVTVEQLSVDPRRLLPQRARWIGDGQVFGAAFDRSQRQAGAERALDELLAIAVVHEDLGPHGHHALDDATVEVWVPRLDAEPRRLGVELLEREHERRRRECPPDLGGHPRFEARVVMPRRTPRPRQPRHEPRRSIAADERARRPTRPRRQRRPQRVDTSAAPVATVCAGERSGLAPGAHDAPGTQAVGECATLAGPRQLISADAGEQDTKLGGGAGVEQRLHNRVALVVRRLGGGQQHVEQRQPRPYARRRDRAHGLEGSDRLPILGEKALVKIRERGQRTAAGARDARNERRVDAAAQEHARRRRVGEPVDDSGTKRRGELARGVVAARRTARRPVPAQ